MELSRSMFSRESDYWRTRAEIAERENDRLRESAMECGAGAGCCYQAAEIELLREAMRIATETERERCCSIVFGMCSSDNVAQRTVDRIRRGG